MLCAPLVAAAAWFTRNVRSKTMADTDPDITVHPVDKATPDLVEPDHPVEVADLPAGAEGIHPALSVESPDAFKAAGAALPRATIPDLTLGQDWRVVFEDDFRTQSNLNMKKWWTRFIFNNGTLDYLNDEWQRFRENGNHVMTADDGLKLTALPHNGHYWPSGAIRTKDCFNISDGNEWYFEAAMKVPRGQGTWSGFWLAADQRPADHGDWSKMPFWPPEIDIMEIVNNAVEDRTTMLHLNVHARQWPNPPQANRPIAATENFSWEWMVWWAPFDFADDFHLFGCTYQRHRPREATMTWYVDRKFIARVNYDWVNDDGLPSGPAHLLAQLSVGGAWAGRHGVDTSKFPQSADVRYIRVHQRLPQGVIGHDLLPR
jgi:beta-glucanase (GH16 family)